VKGIKDFIDIALLIRTNKIKSLSVMSVVPCTRTYQISEKHAASTFRLLFKFNFWRRTVLQQSIFWHMTWQI